MNFLWVKEMNMGESSLQDWLVEAKNIWTHAHMKFVDW